MFLNIILPFLAALCGSAQTTCPPINFLNAKTVNLDPTNTSHLVVLRQSDGSSTAFEMANASPYRVLSTIPNFEKQFSSCLDRALPAAPGKVSFPAPNAPGVAAQPAAFTVLDSGNYLFVLPVANSLDIVVFDHNLQLVSESQVGALTGPGYLQSFLSMVLADMNGDGKLDVVAEYQGLSGGGGVQVFYGDGSGGFQPGGGFSPDGFLYGSMAVADLNGDGKPDVVVGTAGQPGKQTSSGASLVIALNKGDGNFVTSTLPTLDVGPAAIVISDLNRDGNNDLVYLTSFGTTNPPTLNEVVVALGHGDGTFSPQAGIPVNIASSPAPYGNIGTSGAIAVGDMNSDGIPDIVTNGISILLGDGKGGFPTRKDFLNTAGEFVILTDFDGDGRVDVVIGTGNPLVLSALGFVEGTLTVFLGDGTGSLAAAPIAPSPIPITENPSPFSFPGVSVQDASMASGDFNHDGIADLALVTAFQYLTVFLGNASGTLAPIFSYDFSTVDPFDSPTSVAVGDFNGDGVPDLAVTVARSTIARPVAPARIMVFLGKGDGTFLAPVSSNSPVVSIWSLVTGDFNKDGKADVAAINSSGSLAPDQVVVFLGKGDGTFAPAQTYPAGVAAVALAAGDFNQDGAADLAIANQDGISLLLGNAGGTLVPGVGMPFPAQSWLAADLRSDGKLDLVARLYGDTGIAVLLGNGDGTFGPAGIYSGRTGLAIAAGDINGDGIPDIVSIDGGLFIGNGDGTFTYQLNNLFATYGPLVIADFNGDGKLDVASGFFTTAGGVSPLENGAAVFFNLTQPGALLSVVSAADFSNGPLSPHSIVSAFGQHLALSRATGTPPLPTMLGDASVSVQDQTSAVIQAEIYFASPQQVNFVLPAGLEPGTAVVTIKNTDGQSASTEIQIASNPKIFLVDQSGIPAGYVVRVGTDNVQTVEPIFTQQGGQIQEVPIDVSTGSVYLILFGTGFDAPTNPTGSSFRSPCPPNTSTQCEHDLSITYAGPQAQFPGLDQVNILLPSSLAGNGISNLSFSFEASQQNLYVTIQ